MFEIFNQKSFLENDISKTDFYKDFFMTRAWAVFLESKMIPETIEQVQIHKHFDDWIEKLDSYNIFNTPSILFNSKEEEKEVFTYKFSPEKFIPKTSTLK